MLIRAGYELRFELPLPVAMLLLLYTHPSRRSDVRDERLRLAPELPRDEFLDAFGNRCARIAAPAGTLTIANDCLVEDSGEPDPIAHDAPQWEVADLPSDVLQFLLPSRYCEVDRLSEVAWKLFGSMPPGWPRVQAVCDWVHENVTFGYQHARPTKSAYDVYEERQGVCRDFTHLAITLCRALNIPARYATGYLGDICVPAAPYPMDFSAWFEAYLDGQWYTFDARHNEPRVGRILMAVGRDAVDTALTTSFGVANLSGFLVWTDEVAADSHIPSGG
jgi:transglutaminase-like putative cysteine protease